MDAGKSLPLSPFKSKKQLRSPAPSDQKTRKASDPEPNPWSVKTPGKPADPPRRMRNRGAAMSIKEVRQAALKLQERRLDPIARPDPLMVPEEEPVAKQKRKPVVSEISLPEKYELLDKFFSSLDSSIRLLQLKRSATTFTNISSQIESLTDRRFTYSHLGQLKFIMPEAIVVEKILRHDERTSCMRPDLHITLNVEAIEAESKSKSHSRNLQLRKVFRGRLLAFFKSHPEGDDVPEETLPGSFSHPKEDATANAVQTSASPLMSETPDVALPGQTVTASHLSLSFKRRFSQRGSVHHTETLKQEPLVVPAHASVDSGKEASAVAAKSHCESSLKSSGSKSCSPYKACSYSIPSSPLPETPVKCMSSIKDEDQTPVLRTPVDVASTPAKLTSATRSRLPSKRCCMSPEHITSKSPSKLVRRPTPKRPLKFDTPVKSVKVDDDEFGRKGTSSSDDDILDILPEALLQSIREKEVLASMERDPAISQAKWRRQMIAGLPKLFDMIYFLFQSIRRSVVTKEELIEKIITGNLDVVDRREVEEQLRLLQELAPEWIYEKSASSGDLLFCVNKVASPDTIRTRLSEAN